MSPYEHSSWYQHAYSVNTAQSPAAALYLALHTAMPSPPDNTLYPSPYHPPVPVPLKPAYQDLPVPYPLTVPNGIKFKYSPPSWTPSQDPTPDPVYDAAMQVHHELVQKALKDLHAQNAIPANDPSAPDCTPVATETDETPVPSTYSYLEYAQGKPEAFHLNRDRTLLLAVSYSDAVAFLRQHRPEVQPATHWPKDVRPVTPATQYFLNGQRPGRVSLTPRAQQDPAVLSDLLPHALALLQM